MIVLRALAIIAASVIFLANLAMLDVTIAALAHPEREYGIIQIYNFWLWAVSKPVLFMGGNDFLVRIAAGVWAFVAIGLGFVKVVLRII